MEAHPKQKDISFFVFPGECVCLSFMKLCVELSMIIQVISGEEKFVAC